MATKKTVAMPPATRDEKDRRHATRQGGSNALNRLGLYWSVSGSKAWRCFVIVSIWHDQGNSSHVAGERIISPVGF